MRDEIPNPFITLDDDEEAEDFYDEHHEYDGTLSLSKDDWLKLQGLTAEQYERQCDELIQMHREDWELKRQEAAERARRWTWYGY